MARETREGLREVKYVFVLVAALLPSQGSFGHDEEINEGWFNSYMANPAEKFRFFNACESIAYHIGLSGEASLGSAPGEREIANAIESRLRAARILRDDPDGLTSYFNVYLTLAGSAASLRVGFEKFGFVDPYSKFLLAQTLHGMETWHRSWLVEGGFRSGDVLGQLSKLLDEFIVNFLRVNTDEACDAYRLAEKEHEAKMESEHAAARAERAARAVRWKGWSEEQCQSLTEHAAECSWVVLKEEFDAHSDATEKQPE